MTVSNQVWQSRGSRGWSSWRCEALPPSSDQSGKVLGQKVGSSSQQGVPSSSIQLLFPPPRNLRAAVTALTFDLWPSHQPAAGMTAQLGRLRAHRWGGETDVSWSSELLSG